MKEFEAMELTKEQHKLTKPLLLESVKTRRPRANDK
jgi:hypothetical protein